MRPAKATWPMIGLLAQSGLARLADQMAAIVYGWGLLSESGESTDGALVMAASFAALVGGTLFAGRLISILGARVVALAGIWTSVGAASLIALLLHLGLASPALIAVLAACGAILDGPSAIASETHYPQVARLARFDLVRLNALDDGFDGAATLIAPAAGVVLVTGFGLAGGATALALVGLTAALILTGAFPRFKPIAGAGCITLPRVGRALLADTVLAWLTLLLSVAVGVFVAVELVVLPRLLKGTANDARQLTMFLVVGGIAALVGAASSRRFAASLSLRAVIAAAFLSLAAGILLLAVSIETPVLLASAVLSGLPSGLIGPLAASIYQTRPPRALRADMQAVSGALIFAAAPIAVLAAGVAVDAVPAQATLVACAAMMAVAAPIIVVALPSISAQAAMQAQTTGSARPSPATPGGDATAGPTGRSADVDALRGLALFGIIVVNAPFFAGPLNGLPLRGWLDAAAVWFTGAFFAGKFFLIFSFLFGFGFATLLARAERDGSDLRGRFMRRLLGLFVFGALHACFLFFGDILMLYALLGTGLWLCRHWSPRRLLAAALAAYLVALVLQTLALTAALEEATSGPLPPPAANAAYLGGFLDVARARIADLPIALGFIVVFNGMPALAMFLAGQAFGRADAFPTSPAAVARDRRRQWMALVAGGLVSSVAMLGAMGGGGRVAAVSFAALAAAAPALSYGLCGLGLGLFQRHAHSRIVGWLARAGGSSLSGYILHSVILGAVFYGWGLGFYGSLGPAAVLAIGISTFLVVVVLLNIWRRFFRYGPDEWLLRSFVDLRWKPIRNDA
jgi:uncharacterized protein